MTARPRPKNPRPPHPLTRDEFQRLLATPDATMLAGCAEEAYKRGLMDEQELDWITR